MDEFLFQPSVDEKEHIIATYYLQSDNLLKAAKALAIGQSIGNPSIRSSFETERMLKDHLAKILDFKSNLSAKKKGIIKVAYPLENFDIKEDGITQLLCAVAGGQVDIEYIHKCRVLDIEFPDKFKSYFKGPKFGLYEIQKRMKAENRPILGGIVKPKTGATIDELKEICKQMIEGGVDFIKEDEILGSPKISPFKERVEVLSNLVNDMSDDQGREIFYAPCINSDYPYFLERAKFAEKCGCRVVHLNIWAGFSAYRALRDMELKSAIFFQKSGDKYMTFEEHNYSISWKIVCKLARMIGADFIHAGMWGGYLSDAKEDLMEVMHILKGKDVYKPTIPSLSCGSHPGLVGTTIRNFGTELMMNVGGAMHGHPMGTTAGAKAMRQAFEFEKSGGDIKEFISKNPEFKAAIEKWGYVND